MRIYFQAERKLSHSVRIYFLAEDFVISPIMCNFAAGLEQVYT